MTNNDKTKKSEYDILDFGSVEDTTHNIIKVVGVGGGGCNAVANMYKEGMDNVTFCVINTDSKSLSVNPVPHKLLLGKGLGAGADPNKGREEAESNIEDIRSVFTDNTQMVFVAATMGGGTGTGAGPLVARVAKEMDLLTIGVVTLPFYFEKRPKIIKALKGIQEMRKNVDALLIINNEQITNIYSDSHIPVSESLRRADAVMSNAVRSISELITLSGTIQTDFSDVRNTMKNGGGAIMAIGRSSGEHRVQNAVLNALNSPLLYGTDISKATRILFNIYTSAKHELYVDELGEIDAFMDELPSNIEVIWGMATDDSLDEDAKITILATGFDNSLPVEVRQEDTEDSMMQMIKSLYGRHKTHKNASQSPAEKCDDTQELDNNTIDVSDLNAIEKSKRDVDEDIDTSPYTAGSQDEEISEEPIPTPAETFLQRVIKRIKNGIEIMLEPDE